MPKIVKIKRSNVAGSTPTLSYGELGYNAADNKLFAGNAANSSVVVGAGGSSGGGSASIVEASTTAGFPATGSAGTLYHAIDAKKIYFWDSSGVYVEVGTSGGGGSGSFTLPTASDSVLGGIKIGSGLTITDGVVSASSVDATLRALFVPPAPTSVTATISGSDASVSWTAPTVLSQTPITDYTVQYRSSSGSAFTTFTRAASTATSATVTGQGVGGYQFQVSAKNGAGNGAYSSIATLASSKLTATRRNGSPSTFTGLGTAASPFTRAARVLGSNADGLGSQSDGTAGSTGGAYAFTATASGTAYATFTFYDDANDGWAGAVLKNGAGQGGSVGDGQTVTARSFAVAAGDVITFYSGNANTSFANVSVWVV